MNLLQTLAGFISLLGKIFTISKYAIGLFGAILFFGKSLFKILFYVSLPIIIYNIVVKYQVDIINYLLTFIQTNLSLPQAVITIPGIGAYILEHLMITQCLSVILTAITFRFVLSIIFRH